MGKEAKVIYAFLIVSLALTTLVYLHWNGFFNFNRPPIKVGVCAVLDEEFPDMTAIVKIERVGKTQLQISYFCSYARTKTLFNKDISMLRRYYIETPCECKEAL
jgi:hypothetical protein